MSKSKRLFVGGVGNQRRSGNGVVMGRILGKDVATRVRPQISVNGQDKGA